MNRQTLWTRKYNISPFLLWAIAVLGLLALIFVLSTLPICLRSVGSNVPGSGSSLWRLIVITAYLAITGLILLSPVLVTRSEEKKNETDENPEAPSLRRQSLISTMAAGTIQEIRSPLTAARGFVQLISNMDRENEQTKEYSEYALLEIDRIEQLLQEYMLLSRAVAPKSQPVSLLDAAHNAYQIMEAVMSERNIRLQFEGTQPSCILGDQFYLQQILQHLLFNAADATPENGRVSMILQNNGRKVWLTVQDTGDGMDSEIKEHCFDPFFSTKESGTGLGLAICQRMVTDMQGRIEVSSQPGCGTTFRITFPLYLDAPEIFGSTKRG